MDQNPDEPPPLVVDVVLLAPELVVSVLVSEVPSPVCPPPVGAELLVVLVVTALVPPPAAELEPLEALELDPDVPPLELDVVELSALVAVGGDAVPVVGTVSTGAPAVLAELEPPLPQAARATAASIAAAKPSIVRARGIETMCFNPTPSRRD